MTAPVTEILPSAWEMQVEFLAPSFSPSLALTVTNIGRVNRQTDTLFALCLLLKPVR